MLNRVFVAALLIRPIFISASKSCPSGFILSQTCIKSVPSKSPAPSMSLPPRQFVNLLDLHNKYRSIHHSSSLIWNNTLANAAQQLVNKCVFQHDTTTIYGENLYAIFGYNLPKVEQTLTDAVNAWYAEEKEYDYKNPRYSHFTQLVWRASSQLGCAVNDCGYMRFISCKYYPPGNVLGQFERNVFDA